MSIDSMIARMTRWSELQAEQAGLNWSTDGKRIKEIAIELDAAEQPRRLFDRNRMPKVHPFFLSIDDSELVGGYVLPTHDGTGIACGILDLIASRLSDECPIDISIHANWHTMLYSLGGDVIAPCIATLRDAVQSVEQRHVRFELEQWPRDADGYELVGQGTPTIVSAPIDTDDDRFCELGFARCGADDEHATEIMSFDLDEGLLEPVFDLVRSRGDDAKKVLRGIASVV